MNAIKVVPNAEPNAEGVWIIVSDAYNMNIPIRNWEFAFRRETPPHHHVVGVTSRYEEEA